MIHLLITLAGRRYAGLGRAGLGNLPALVSLPATLVILSGLRLVAGDLLGHCQRAGQRHAVPGAGWDSGTVLSDAGDVSARIAPAKGLAIRGIESAWRAFWNWCVRRFWTASALRCKLSEWPRPRRWESPSWPSGPGRDAAAAGVLPVSVS